MQLTQQETDRRLAEHLCVWCATPLRDYDPDWTFCSVGCQHLWHAWRNGGDEGVTQARLNGAIAAAIDNEQQAAQNSQPNSVRNSYQLDEQFVMGDLPERGGHQSATQREVEDRLIRADMARIYRPGNIAGEPQRIADNSTTIGWLTEWTSGTSPAALTEIDPEPSPEPYPHIAAGLHASVGWKLALNGSSNPLLPHRWCPNCNIATPIGEAVRNYHGVRVPQPVNIPAIFVAESDQPVQELDAIRDRPAERVIQYCTDCGYEHTDTPAVAMIRPQLAVAPQPLAGQRFGLEYTGNWELAAVTTQGTHIHTITRELCEQAVRERSIAAWVWVKLFREAHQQASQHCHMPGCDKAATQWLLLAAPLTHQGYRWTPTDRTPIRLGLCTVHHSQIISSLLINPHLIHRTEHNPNNARIRIR
jgi:predicted nucleic acid-binding Zn ribbon protein